MKFIINSTILSLPPYISTTWKNINFLQVRQEGGSFTLVVTLFNKNEIEVPHLDQKTIDSIFEAHAEYNSSPPRKDPMESPFSFSLPLKPDGPIDTLGSSMQHNPELADTPPLPPEVLAKITAIARAFGLENSSALPKAEPHCNCVYCQLARSLQGEEPLNSDLNEVEVVTDEDLHFRNWEVNQTAEKLYRVTNPLDQNEKYNVFLGEPLGCTCGMKNCEHIRAVLST